MEENKPIVRIAVSYAKEDQGLLDKLKKHLSPLTRSGYVDTWDDRDILAGAEWSTEIDTRLKAAHIILLLVSPDFIASDYCYGVEMMQALAEHEKANTHVLPIILRPIEWRNTPFGKLWSLPSNGNPIVSSSWQYTDEALADVARGIHKVVEEVRAKLLRGGQKHFVSPSRNYQTELSKQEVQPFTRIPNCQVNHEVESALQERPVTFVASDGKLMQLIPTSKFLFNDSQLLELPDFYIDTWPVTNREYLRFLLEQNVIPPASWRGKKFLQNKAEHPATGMNWYEAMAYAKWAGKRLPTAAEWEKAARGSDGRRYPWGEVFDVLHCNTLESKRKTSTPVTQHPSGASTYGVLDMAGNVWEWTTDEVTPRGMGRQNQETKRALKGGSWNTPKGSAECIASTSAWPSEQLMDAGFRCVLSIDKAVRRSMNDIRQ